MEVLLYGAFWLWLLALIPVAVATLAKGRLLLFFLGWITLGIAWFVGAFSTDPEADSRSPRAEAIWLWGSLAVIVALGLLATRPVPVLGVDGRALQYSVDGGGFSSSDNCVQEKAAWTCHVYDSNLSGSVPYRVEIGNFGCWTATGGWPTEGSPRRLSGCITIWDEIRLWNTIF